MDYSRLAALKVATLHESDLAWLLKALPAPLAQTLQQHLDELQQLGIENQQEVLQSLLQQQSQVIENAVETEQPDALSQLINHFNSFAVTDIKALLKTLPPALSAIFIALYDWSWRDAVKAPHSVTVAQTVPAAVQLAVLQQVQAIGEA